MQILPHDLSHFKGGQELESAIDNLTTKVNLFRAEQKQLQCNGGIGTMTRTEESLLPPAAPSEIKGLLSSKDNSAAVRKTKKDETSEEVSSSKAINVTIEQGILSLNDPEFETRDTSVNPDLV